MGWLLVIVALIVLLIVSGVWGLARGRRAGRRLG